jgi:hypothetical protein
MTAVLLRVKAMSSMPAGFKSYLTRRLERLKLSDSRGARELPRQSYEPLLVVLETQSFFSFGSAVLAQVISPPRIVSHQTTGRGASQEVKSDIRRGFGTASLSPPLIFQSTLLVCRIVQAKEYSEVKGCRRGRMPTASPAAHGLKPPAKQYWSQNPTPGRR